MPLIGTAGHVDHGKSSLIQRLTGRDPDRWAEEKERGLTIDLGFAWMSLADGLEVSFVDVPGHERYLKNMLAGIEAIDVALLVVAADEGWMPQTEEHLAVLDLLEVNSGVVVLTKADLVDQDLLDLAQLEIEDRIAGTSLEGSDVVRVSNKTGQGVDDLVKAMTNLAKEVVPRDLGRPRLWIDRVFSATGSGTVATGTLLDGVVAVDDQIRVYPDATRARIRAIQSHETSHERVLPGSRVALNLAGVEHDDLNRGQMIGRGGDWDVTDRFLATLRPARYVDEVPRRGAYQLHVGSAAHAMEFAALEGGAALIRTPTPVPLAYGDRFIVRDTGRKLVVAGGRVLDPAPGRTAAAIRSHKTLSKAETRDEAATALLEIRGSATLDLLAAQTAGGVPQGNTIAGRVHAESEISRLSAQMAGLVDRNHAEYPLRAGVSLATLATELGVSPEAAESLVERNPDLARVGPDVANRNHSTSLSPAQEESWAGLERKLRAGLAVPLVSELEIDQELLHLKQRQGGVVVISQDLVFLPEQVEQLVEILRAMEGDFTVADFRDAAGLSRKYAVPILEWADKEGLTVRQGDTRRVR